MKGNLLWSKSTNWNVDLIQKIPIKNSQNNNDKKTAKVSFNQISKHCGQAKLTHTINHHTSHCPAMRPGTSYLIFLSLSSLLRMRDIFILSSKASTHGEKCMGHWVQCRVHCLLSSQGDVPCGTRDRSTGLWTCKKLFQKGNVSVWFFLFCFTRFFWQTKAVWTHQEIPLIAGWD